MTNVFDLPNQFNDLEKQEQLDALANVANTAEAKIKELSPLRFSANYPADLMDYTNYLCHDTNRGISNLRYHIKKGDIDNAIWRAMYQCLHWIQQLDILLELLAYRSNDDPDILA